MVRIWIAISYFNITAGFKRILDKNMTHYMWTVNPYWCKLNVIRMSGWLYRLKVELACLTRRSACNEISYSWMHARTHAYNEIIKST